MKIYASNLSFNTDEASLTELFSKFGTVNSVSIIAGRETGRSLRFAFIDMPSEDEGREAIDKLNYKEVESRPMQVAVAKTGTGKHRQLPLGYQGKK